MTVVPRRQPRAERDDVWRSMVLQLEPGAVQRMWDEDKLTLDQATRAMAIREHAGLEP